MKFKFEVGQKVRILDGSRIEDYTGSWNRDMADDVGKVVTITDQIEHHNRFPAYRADETIWLLDERGLEAVKDMAAPGIRKVIFNNPATIVLWADGTKTVVKAYKEAFDPEKGLAMCFMKKALGNRSAYNRTLKALTEDEYTEEIGDRSWQTYFNPGQSGWYLAITKSGLETDIHYSKKYDTWNAFDEQTLERADECEITVLAWRPLNA